VAAAVRTSSSVAHRVDIRRDDADQQIGDAHVVQSLN
jgi:hypothetical protein